MNYFLTELLSFLLLYKYVGLFLIIYSSAIIVPWPENTILLAAGAFASQGYFNPELTFTVALVANVLGDVTDYGLTRIWGYRVIKEHHLTKYSYINRLRHYVREHAGLTIFATRFTGTIGPLVNFLAGLIGVSFGRFLAFDILGNALDIGIFVVAGYVLGSVWQSFSGIAEIIGWIVLVLFLIYMVIGIIRKKRA